MTAAVNSAAIGVAGFFTPFVHEVSNGEIRHLCATRHSRTRTQRLGVSAEFVAEDRTFPDARRPTVRLTESDAAWAYRATADPGIWTHDLPPGPLLLHVDFDYFCNRFDGDSDWALDPPENDVPSNAVAARVDAVVNALDAAGVGDRVTDVCGALSPGFFPAEFWAPTVARLADGLRDLGIDTSAWR